MAGGVSINVLSNVRGAVSGVDSVADAVEEVVDALNDLTKEGDTATDRMEADFRDLSRSADRESDKLRDKFRQAYKDVKRASDDTADDVIRSQRRMGEKSAEVGQEVRQNLGEGIANAARGDFASLSDTIGDTLGGAVAGIGGLGTAAIGVAGAVGLGAVVAAFQLINDHASKLEDRANDMATAFIQAGTNVLDATAVASAAADVITDKDKRAEVKAYADALGIDLATAARAYVGDVNAMAAVDAVAAKAREDSIAIADEQREALKALTPEQQRQLEANQAALNAQRELTGVVGEANAKFQDQQDVLMGLIRDAGTATEEVDELGNTVYTLPDGVQILIDAETGQATTDVSKFKGDVDGVPRTVDVRFKAWVDDYAWRTYRPPTKNGYIVARPVTTQSGDYYE